RRRIPGAADGSRARLLPGAAQGDPGPVARRHRGLVELPPDVERRRSARRVTQRRKHMTPIVESRALSKPFGNVDALRRRDLVVEPGHVVALLGPNGAGKTTFVRTVATLLRPDSGTLRVGGYDVVTQAAKVRALIGLAGQYAAVEGAMTGRENL